MNEDVNINLTGSVLYDFKGDKVEAKFVTLKAPTSKNISECAIMKQCFYKAVRFHQRNSDVEDTSPSPSGKLEDDGKLEAGDLMQMIYASDADTDKLFIAAKKLFKNNIMLFDGETTATLLMIENLPVDDFENIVGGYIVNFIVASII